MTTLREAKERKKQESTQPAGTWIEGVKLYTWEETAQLLGVCVRTAKTYHSQNKIRAVKIGRRKLISAESIAEYLKGK